jgi:hypothetical protein
MMEVNSMAYFNPFPFPNFGHTSMAPMPPHTGMNQTRPPIDAQQFRQFAMTLNDNSLAQFAQMARAQGISEQDIQQGIKFIKSM